MKCKYGFVPVPTCDNCSGTGEFENNEACAFCQEDAVKTGQIDGTVDGVPYKRGVPNGLVGVVWDEDFGLVDLITKKILIYGYSEAVTLSWYVPCITIENDDFAVLLSAEDREDRDDDDVLDDKVDDKATWDNVIAVLLHEDFLFSTNLRQPEVYDGEEEKKEDSPG